MEQKHENHLPTTENQEIPIQKSAVELATNMAEITTGAMLIVAQPLNYEPKCFSKHHFQKEREFLLNQPSKKQEILLEQLSLRLSKEQREKNADAVRNFLNNFKEYIPHEGRKHFRLVDGRDIKVEKGNNFTKRKLGKLYSKGKDLDFKMMKEALSSLTESEVYIQDVFETYQDLTHILNDLDIDIHIFEEIMQNKERENRIEHTMH